MNSTYVTACKLLTLGYSVIPSGGDKGKAPLVNWQTARFADATSGRIHRMAIYYVHVAIPHKEVSSDCPVS